jgi:transposase
MRTGEGSVDERPAVEARATTLLLLWEEYRAEHANGYGYSRFCDLYRDWRQTISPTMRQTHGPAEKLFVDFAGDTVPVFGATTRTERRAHVFVAVLGASNYTYAEARWSEGLADWIGAHVNASNTIGGVPKAVVCDNRTSHAIGRSRHCAGTSAMRKSSTSMRVRGCCDVSRSKTAKSSDKANCWRSVAHRGTGLARR